VDVLTTPLASTLHQEKAFANAIMVSEEMERCAKQQIPVM
jgi:hypothetical protein